MVTKCSLIILHSLLFHPPSAPFCLLIKLHLLSFLFFFLSVRVSPLFFWLQFNSFTLFFFFAVVSFFFLRFFLGGGGGQRKSGELPWQQLAGCKLPVRCITGKERERERWSEREMEGCLLLSLSTVFFCFSVNKSQRKDRKTRQRMSPTNKCGPCLFFLCAFVVVQNA